VHVIQNKDKNVIIKSTKCEKIFISWIHKVFKQIVSPFKSGCHLYSDRDQQTGNSCRYGNIRKNFILPFIGNSELKFMLKKVAGTSKWVGTIHLGRRHFFQFFWCPTSHAHCLQSYSGKVQLFWEGHKI
jgi:hypothetical protein